jgi:hypothetical protein
MAAQAVRSPSATNVPLDSQWENRNYLGGRRMPVRKTALTFSKNPQPDETIDNQRGRLTARDSYPVMRLAGPKLGEV